MEWLIGIGIAAAAVVLLLIAGYVKSPPDTAYIISGFRKPRILIGKACNVLIKIPQRLRDRADDPSNDERPDAIFGHRALFSVRAHESFILFLVHVHSCFPSSCFLFIFRNNKFFIHLFTI